jgi:cytochrome c553
MSTEKLFSLRNRWFTGAVGLTVVIAAASVAVGFVLLPSLQTEAGFSGVWDEICTAAGLVRAPRAAATVVKADFTTTDVVVTPQMLGPTDVVSIGRGATLALQCTMCHGARGLSQADSPNLAGQYPSAIYKQLHDYKSGARTNAVMSPLMINLQDQDMRDLAAYFAYLPRLPGYHPTGEGPAPRIVVSGAPMRNIAPCASCHGALEYKLGSAWLEGESPVYLKAQLEAFATGARRNDISQQMRNVARNMSPAEMQEAADYYAHQPAPNGAAASAVAR